MIQVFHKYKKTVVGSIFLLLIAVTLTGLGLDPVRMVNRGDNDYAIKINDAKISFAELARMKRGDQQEEGSQKVIDRVISASILEQKANSIGLAAGDQAVRSFIQSNVFQGDFSADEYRGFLSQIGMSSRGFEDEIRRDVLRQQFASIVSDAIIPTHAEIVRAIEQFDSTYDVAAISFAPGDFTDKIANQPTEEEIENFYGSNSDRFEIPQGASYEYVTFSPSQYVTAVPVTPEDIEFYYSENTSQFKVAESLSAKRIRLLYPKDATPEEMNKLKEKAVLAHSRAQAGEPFDGLVLEFSDDLISKGKGGDLGTITRGFQSPEFDSVVFSMKRSGIAPLVEADYGFEIVEITDYKPETTKPLDAVRDEIAKQIQLQDAPIYASTRAHDLFTEWQKSGETLEQFTAGRGLKLEKTSGILSGDNDPSEELIGLTNGVLETTEENSIVDVKDKVVIVHVTERREADIAPLVKVRDQIISAINNDKARALARETAQKIKDTINAENKPLSDVAKSNGYTVQSIEGISPIVPKPELPSSPEFINELSQVQSGMKLMRSIYEHNGKFWVIQVTAVHKPTAEKLKEREAIFKTVSRSQIANAFLQSVIEKEKSQSKIEVNPQAM